MKKSQFCDKKAFPFGEGGKIPTLSRDFDG